MMEDVIFWSVKCLEKELSLFSFFFKYQSVFFFVDQSFHGFFCLFVHLFLRVRNGLEHNGEKEITFSFPFAS